MILLGAIAPGAVPPLSTLRRGAKPNPGFHPKIPSWGSSCPLSSCKHPLGAPRTLRPAGTAGAGKNADRGEAATDAQPQPRQRRARRRKPEDGATVGDGAGASPGDVAGRVSPSTIPRKPRRGRRNEAAAVEDFVRDSLEHTFAEIRRQSPDVLKGKEGILKEGKAEDGAEGQSDDGDYDTVGTGWKAAVEEEDPDWPLDADVGWGIRASEYFDKHPIRNVVVGGVEIDWEGELENELVKEINCLEWESFVFHPSPLIVLVFERYNRAADNWNLLKELEKAAVVYWSAKDRLPPRTVKIDMNIEKDLAYALKVKECPQLLFLRGNRILYREKEMRTADELVQMIAHFYYNAKRPPWVDATAVAPPYQCLSEQHSLSW